ncbi:hypothetical protein Tco_0245581 [Tanacetum coccineum]
MGKSFYGNRRHCIRDTTISNQGIEVDRAKVDVIAKLPHPTTMKGVRSFRGHAGFYRRFIQDFSKIARPMTHLLEKEHFSSQKSVSNPLIHSKEIYGKDQVYNWPRSYTVQPPNGESLEMCLKRVVAQLMAGKHAIGTSIIMKLEDYNDKINIEPLQFAQIAPENQYRRSVGSGRNGGGGGVMSLARIHIPADTDASHEDNKSHKTRPCSRERVVNWVRIYKKSQENSQKRANTDTRNGRAQEKPKIQEPEAKVEKSTLGQFSLKRAGKNEYYSSSPPKLPTVKTKGFSQLRGTKDYSSEVQHNGRVNYVKSRALIGSLKLDGHVDVEKAQKKRGFTLLSLT